MRNSFVFAALLLPFLFGISANSHSQSLNEAVQFIYCSDREWGPNCGFTAEFSDCTVTISAPSLGGVLQVIHFNKVIWNSVQFNVFPQNITANCSGNCVEDPEGILAKVTAIAHPDEFMMNDFKVNFTSISMGYLAAPQRVLNALNVIIDSCPGVESVF